MRLGTETYGIGDALAFCISGELCWLTARGDRRSREGLLERDGHDEEVVKLFSSVSVWFMCLIQLQMSSLCDWDVYAAARL